MDPKIKTPKKLIEVALPLDDINAASASEKAIRLGHPANIHLWWARRPLAAARAVLFAQMVNDPGGERGYYSGKTKSQADAEREELFKIMRELVQWKNMNNESVLKKAQIAILKSWKETCELNKGIPGFDPEKLPAFHDPFAGGGAIPLEAQRLGLESHASDLNPVAVLINKAMIEIPPKFVGRSPIGPIPTDIKQRRLQTEWPGATGLAEDVQRYGNWVLEEANNRIGHLYTKVEVTSELVKERQDLRGLEKQNLTVIAWLWARTVKSPNPAFSHIDVPLASSFILSSKKGKEAYIQPEIKGDRYHFKVCTGKPMNFEELKKGTKLSRGANFKCILSESPIEPKYIKEAGRVGAIGSRLMAIVAKGPKGRVYLSPTAKDESIVNLATPQWEPNIEFAKNSRHMTPWVYGLTKFSDLFSSRQLVALNTFSDIVQEVKNKVKCDAKDLGWNDDNVSLEAGGTSVTAYGDAISTYLAFAVSKTANRSNTLSSWMPNVQCPGHLFKRHALSMCWDYSEANVVSGPSGSFQSMFENTSAGLISLGAPKVSGHAVQADSQNQDHSTGKVVSTDPPYYDNVPYADLSDFFYVWLRRSLKSVYPDIFSTIAVPKTEELVADQFRHGSKIEAEEFFMNGMMQTIKNLENKINPAFPLTIYYAFKQSETKAQGTSSTGWETFLDAIIRSNMIITGTWPFRTERENRTRNQDSNALASSIILVCRKRPKHSETISRRQFQRELRDTLPESLEIMIGGVEGTSPVAPVDLSQAAIGSGIAVFSKYDAVFNQDGSSMSVHDALILINREITAFLTPDSGSFDNDTLFCSTWFDQYGWKAGPFGEADTLSRAKGTSVDGVKDAGVIESGGGKVRLLQWKEYEEGWDPKKDNRTPVWEALHYLIRALNLEGESESGRLLSRMPERAEPIRQLAYHLYTLCERKKWADNARAYNELITSWHGIASASHEAGHIGTQGTLDFED